MSKKNFNIPVELNQYQKFEEAAQNRAISTTEMGRTCLMQGYKLVVENQNPDLAQEANEWKQKYLQLEEQLANTQRQEANKAQEAQMLLGNKYEEEIKTLNTKIKALEAENESLKDASGNTESQDFKNELEATQSDLQEAYEKLDFYEEHPRVNDLFEKLVGETHTVNTHTGDKKKMAVESIKDVWAIIAEAFRI